MTSLWRLLAACAVTMTTLAQAASPTETLDRFHQTLRENNAPAAMALLAVEAVIFEQGFAETTRAEWANGQIQDAIAFARATERTTLRRESRQVGDIAWVLSTTATTGRFEDRSLALEGTETAILRLEAADWKIVHLHWSAHEPPQAEPEATPSAKGSGLESDLDSRN